MKSIEKSLSEHPFFDGLSAAHLQLLAIGASEAHYDEDEFIFHEHDAADSFYVIVEGSVALKIHGSHLAPITIQTISSGQALGWSWLIPPYKWHFDARTFSPVTALMLNAEHVRKVFEDNPELGYKMLLRINQVLADRLQATRLQLLDVYRAAT